MANSQMNLKNHLPPSKFIFSAYSKPTDDDLIGNIENSEFSKNLLR